MEFLHQLYKFFPYVSIITLDKNTLTAWWVVGTIGVFGYFSIHILQICSRLQENIKKALSDLSEVTLSSNILLIDTWNDYYETFIDFFGSKKTDEFSYDFFNEKNLLSSTTNLKMLNSVNGILVGLGILGTFVGLTVGISNVKTGSTEEITLSIKTLLSGMGTAFVSSVWGMLLSLLFIFIEKHQLNNLHNSIHKLCYELDKRYRISKEDERKMEVSRQKEILSDYFIYKDDNGNVVKPGNVLRDIYDSVYLVSFIKPKKYNDKFIF
ncbi:MAG: MotA/TolQ/ExbB proton channel family protein [Candidatus Desantisbacteria bacterium]